MMKGFMMIISVVSLIMLSQISAVAARVSSEEIALPPGDSLSAREMRRSRRASRNMRFSILGGPSYSPDFGLVIGGSALFTFRMDKSDLELPRSVVPLAIAFMTKGGVKVVSKPQLFFLRTTVSASSGNFSMRIIPTISMVWAMSPTETMSEVLPQVFSGRANFRSIRFFCSASARLTGLRALIWTSHGKGCRTSGWIWPFRRIMSRREETLPAIRR